MSLKWRFIYIFLGLLTMAVLILPYWLTLMVDARNGVGDNMFRGLFLYEAAMAGPFVVTLNVIATIIYWRAQRPKRLALSLTGAMTGVSMVFLVLSILWLQTNLGG